MSDSSALIRRKIYPCVKVAKDYYCDMDEVTHSKIHLYFLSEEHYNKIEEIGKMFEKFF